MSYEFLHRDDAPFGEAVWKIIDTTVTEAAKSQLSGRRLLHTEGPYGLHLKDIPENDAKIGEAALEGVTVSVSSTIPVVMIRTNFTLAARDIAQFQATGIPFNTSKIAQAAIRLARQEDDLIFNGNYEVGAKGLFSSENILNVQLGQWDNVGAAVENIIQAATTLDGAGFRGPYTLGLAPSLYNMLFRRYPQGDSTELEHMRVLVTDGVVKAPSIQNGGVLIASGRQFANIILGMDMAAGFVGPEEEGYEFFIIESLALKLRRPDAVCVIR